MDPATINLAISKSKSPTVRKLLNKLKEGGVSAKSVMSKLNEYINTISTKNNPRDVEEHLEKYRDALMILPILQGEGAPGNANVNAKVIAVRNSFTRRATGRSAARKANAAAAAAARPPRGPKTSAEREANKTRRAEKKAAQKAHIASHLAQLAADPKYGRKSPKRKAVQEVLDTITLQSPPEYIKRVIDSLQSQIYRFNADAKQEALDDIQVKLTELTTTLARRKKSTTKPISASEVKAYEDKIAALETLAAVVGIETNVEMSNSNAKSIRTAMTSTTARSTATRSRAVGSKMSCKKLRHPCNTRIILTKEQLMSAAEQIMKNGYAIREAGFPGTEGSATPAASGAAAAAASGARAGAGGDD